MESNPHQERKQAHAYLDPVSRALANAPIDDEPVTEAEERAVFEAREWLKHNPGIPFEKLVTELGFTMEEVNNYQDPSGWSRPRKDAYR